MNKKKLSTLLRNSKVDAGKNSRKELKMLVFGDKTWGEGGWGQNSSFSQHEPRGTTELCQLRAYITLKKRKTKTGFKSKTNTRRKTITPHSESLPSRRFAGLSGFVEAGAGWGAGTPCRATGFELLHTFPHKPGGETDRANHWGGITRTLLVFWLRKFR